MARDFIEIQKYLSGVDYPASKRQLVEHAKSNGAPEDLLNDLNGIPDEEYDGPNRVSSAVAHS
jgi:hypothetical protein